MAARYWVGNSGNYNQTAHWSATSGGAGGVSVPTSSDDVFFDANSFSAGGQTVTLPTGSDYYAKSLDFTGVTNSPTLNIVGSARLRVYRNVTLNSSVTYTGSGSLFMAAQTSADLNATLTTNNASLGFELILNKVFGAGNVGSTSVVGNFTATNDVFIGDNSTASSSVITFDGTSAKTFTITSFSTFNQLAGLTNNGTGALTIDNENQFNAGVLTLTRGSTTKFKSGKTVVISSLNITGSSGYALLRSTTAGTRFTLTSSASSISADYMDIQDSAATGTTFFAGNNSIDSGNNTGWIFTDPEYEGEATTGVEVDTSADGVKAGTAEATTGTEVSLEAIGNKQFTESGVPKKTYYYKAYDEDDNFKGLIDDVIQDPSWTHEINSPGSVMELELARNSDSTSVEYGPILDSDNNPILDSQNSPILGSELSRNKVGPGSNVNHNYRVDILVFYGAQSPILDSDGLPILDSNNEPIIGTIGSPNGRVIFTGFISEISSRYGGSETTIIELTSYGWDLDQYLINDEGDTKVAFNSYDPSNIVIESMNQFDSEGGVLTPSAAIQPTGTTVSYTFNTNTYLEVLEKTIELAPDDWYYYVDLGTNEVFFAAKPATATHTFLLQKHINYLDLKSYILKSTNEVVFVGQEDEAGDNLFRRYTRTPAVGTRRVLRRIVDQRVSLVSTADTISDTLLDRENKIQYRTTVDILDSVYDIETIKVGDTVNFRNFDNYVDQIEPLQVVALTYRPDRVSLQLDTMALSIEKRIEDISRNQEQSDFSNNPAAPTAV